MRIWLRAVRIIVVVLCVAWVSHGSVGVVLAATATSDLTATIHSTNPLKPTLTLKNISDHACQIATSADGTVAITKVAQGGKAITPSPSDTASDEDIGYLLQTQLKTLQPGQTSDIALATYKLKSGYVLRSTTWSSGSSFGSEFAIHANQPLQLEANYSLPIIPASGAPACSAVFASGFVTSQSSGRMWLIIGSSILLFIALVGFILWLWFRRHHHKAAAATVAAVFVVLGLGVWWHAAPHAFADVVVPPELQSVYDGCIGTFEANRDITGPILDILNNPANHFEIVHRTTPGSDMTGRPDPSHPGGGIFRIYWNPDDHHRYAGGGGYPDACTSLYHELYHALDMLNGTFSRDDCAGSGIETKEVMATRAQNVLRLRLGLPARTHYGDRPLPSGDCSARPRPTSCTGARCGDTNGDPHLHTFDGLRYDFQGAGEFIASRSQTGDFEIQVRQQPWTNSQYVAINTAVAMKVGGQRVEVRAGQTLMLLVDGVKQPLASIKLNNGEIDVSENLVTITWADGTVAYVESVGMYGVSLSVQLADGLSNKVDGLLGNADDNDKNDLHNRGSTTAIQPVYAQLYPAFADSWRITDQSSLFTYDKGKHTASYTIKDFPHKLDAVAAIPGYAAAENYCKNSGITDPAILANCALDVAITGRPEFARSAATSQTFTAGADFGGTTWQLTIANPGDSASVTFQAQAGEKIFVQVPKTSVPSQCGTLRLLGPDAREITNGCLINGSGEIDGTVLPTAGTYTISLTPGGPTGTATVRLLRISDQQGTITPDGDSVTARISQPGVVARFTFSASAGQRAYLDVPSSTLDSQCGIIRITAPDGHEVSNGCIINHAGYIDTVALADSGTYTVVVDPNDITIGQARLRLIFPTAETKPIVMDGPTLSVNLAKPGSTAAFTFSGNAGQRVFIDLPSSDLPSQCGLLVLHAPDGTGIASGCVINHKGNLIDDGAILPANGTYTITLDPGASDTGTTTIKLRSH